MKHIFPTIRLMPGFVSSDASRFLSANVQLLIAVNPADLGDAARTGLAADRWALPLCVQRSAAGYLIPVTDDAGSADVVETAPDLWTLLRHAKHAGATHVSISEQAPRLPARMAQALQVTRVGRSDITSLAELGAALQRLTESHGPVHPLTIAATGYMVFGIDRDHDEIRRTLIALRSEMASVNSDVSAAFQLDSLSRLLVGMTTVGDLCVKDEALFHGMAPEIQELSVESVVGDTVCRAILQTAMHLHSLADVRARTDASGVTYTDQAVTALCQQAETWYFG